MDASREPKSRRERITTGWIKGRVATLAMRSLVKQMIGQLVEVKSRGEGSDPGVRLLPAGEPSRVLRVLRGRKRRGADLRKQRARRAQATHVPSVPSLSSRKPISARSKQSPRRPTIVNNPSSSSHPRKSTNAPRETLQPLFSLPSSCERRVGGKDVLRAHSLARQSLHKAERLTLGCFASK